MTLKLGRIVVRRQFQRDDLLRRVWMGRVAADDEGALRSWHPDPLWSVPTALPVGWDRSQTRA